MAKQSISTEGRVFDRDEALQIMPYPNGGWTILQQAEMGYVPKKIGSYTNAEEMIAALSAMLVDQGKTS